MLKAEEYNEIQVSKRIEFLIFISVFVSSITFFTSPFEGYLHYAVFLSLLPFFVLKFGIPKFVFQLLGIPLGVGLINVYLGNCEPFSFIKVFGGLLLSLLFYYYVYLYYGKNLKRIFQVYLKWSYWVSIIGLIQVVSYNVRFKPGYDFHWILNKWGAIEGGLMGIRVNSIFPEASQFAIVMGPAVYVSIYNLLHKNSFTLTKTHAVVILISVFLSTSSTGYLGIMISFLLASDGIRLRYIVFGGLFSIVAFNVIYSNVPEFKIRVDAAIALWVYQDFKIENTNTSSFVLYNNYHIATTVLESHPIFGAGLGSHEVAYDRYSLTNNMAAFKEGFAFNKSDANSLFLRLLSETGLLGVGFMILVLVRGYVGKQQNHLLFEYRIVGQASLVIILLYLLRQGNYFINGFPLFVYIYYFNKINLTKKKQELLELAEENIAQEETNSLVDQPQ